jgi:hypothetical protein
VGGGEGDLPRLAGTGTASSPPGSWLHRELGRWEVASTDSDEGCKHRARWGALRVQAPGLGRLASTALRRVYGVARPVLPNDQDFCGRRCKAPACVLYFCVFGLKFSKNGWGLQV